MKEVSEYIGNSSIKISEDTYSIIKATVMYHDSFAMIKRSNDNITLVVKEKEATYHIPTKEILAIDNGWKIITIDAELPFELIGFLATIADALAKADISIFALSSFDTDHILVKEDRIDEAIQVLTGLGFSRIND